MTRLKVMTNAAGEVIATHAVDKKPAGSNSGVKAEMRPLPGQTLHEIEFEMPDSFRNEAEVDQFHLAIGQALATKKNA
jgi:hypothetical protein